MAEAVWPRSGCKRALDVLAASVLLCVLAPLMAAIALAVRIGWGRPVFFRQIRPGKDGRPFVLVKFRTLAADQEVTETPEGKIPPTRLAAFLRGSGLDELPELWNIFRGDMSFVGPRPLLMRYLDRYTSEQARRHHVRPGLTGWAQIHGRNAVDWPTRLTLDVWYVDHATWRTDLEVVLRTFVELLVRRGSVEPGEFK